MNVVHDPGGLGYRIENIWAYLTVHGENDEGITAINAEGMGMMPLIVGNEGRAHSFRSAAEKVAAMTGKSIMLARFHNRTDEGLIVP